MNNRELFKSTFLKVHVDENKIKEIIKMKDTKKAKKSYAKKLIVIAACIGCALSAAIAVNAATDGEVTREITGWSVNADGEKTPIKVIKFDDENGNPIGKIYCYEIINTNDTSEQVLFGENGIENDESLKKYCIGEVHFSENGSPNNKIYYSEIDTDNTSNRNVIANEKNYKIYGLS